MAVKISTAPELVCIEKKGVGTSIRDFKCKCYNVCDDIQIYVTYNFDSAKIIIQKAAFAGHCPNYKFGL